MVKNLYTSTVLKAFEILECFEDGSRELGIKELSLQVGMPPSSLHHIVNSLEYIGMVYQNEENKKYRMGPRCLEMSYKSQHMAQYRQIAEKRMKALEQETGENVNLAIDEGDSVILIHKEECGHMLRPNFPLYTPFKSYKTGLGRVMLAEKSDAALERIYQENQKDIGMTREAFFKMVESVRQNGYAYDDQVFCSGLRCIAAPIRGPGGRVLISVSVSAPMNRMSDETCQRVCKLLVKYMDLASGEIQGLG